MVRRTRTRMQRAFLPSMEFEIGPEDTVEPLHLEIDRGVIERKG